MLTKLSVLQWTVPLAEMVAVPGLAQPFLPVLVSLPLALHARAQREGGPAPVKGSRYVYINYIALLTQNSLTYTLTIQKCLPTALSPASSQLLELIMTVRTSRGAVSVANHLPVPQKVNTIHPVTDYIITSGEISCISCSSVRSFPAQISF